jgi:serine/threonine protein kinase
MEASGGKLGPYTILRRVAVGGMGEVYLAWPDPGRGTQPVALKRLLPDLASSAEYLKLFLDEARLVAQLYHPNIARIYDLGADDKVDKGDPDYYLAMEYIRGVSLRQMMDRTANRKERIPAAHVLEIGLQILSALAYAHGFRDKDGTPLNVVHRDVTPANILVGFDGNVKLIDFGVAKSNQQSHKTEAGTVKGKLAYMSPEQARGKSFDHRSDLFSFGIVLCEALTGENPFNRDDNVLLTVTAITEEAPAFPSRSDPALAPFDPIVAKLLTKKPEYRYAAAAEVAGALAQLRGQLPKPESGLTEWLKKRFAREIEEDERSLAEVAQRKEVAHLETVIRPAASVDDSAKPTELALSLEDIERESAKAFEKDRPARRPIPGEPSVQVAQFATEPGSGSGTSSDPNLDLEAVETGPTRPVEPDGLDGSTGPRLDVLEGSSGVTASSVSGPIELQAKSGTPLVMLALVGVAAAILSAVVVMGLLARRDAPRRSDPPVTVEPEKPVEKPRESLMPKDEGAPLPAEGGTPVEPPERKLPEAGKSPAARPMDAPVLSIRIGDAQPTRMPLVSKHSAFGLPSIAEARGYKLSVVYDLDATRQCVVSLSVDPEAAIEVDGFNRGRPPVKIAVAEKPVEVKLVKAGKENVWVTLKLERPAGGP